MTVESAPLVQASYMEVAETTEYISPNVAIIDAAFVTNVSSDVQTFSISVVANGDMAGQANRGIKDKELRPDETYLCPELVGQVLTNSDYVSTIGSASASLVFRMSGRVVS